MTAFFGAASGVASTLWVVSIALLTIVLTRPATGDALGFLSQQVRTMRSIAASTDLAANQKAVLEGMMATHRALWFLTEFAPIVMFFQSALLTSLLALLPNSPHHAIALVIGAHVIIFDRLLAAAKKTLSKFQQSVLKIAPAITEESTLPQAERRRLVARTMAPEILILALAVVVWNWASPMALAIAVMVAIAAGMLVAIASAYDIATAREI